MGARAGDELAAYFAARATVTADLVFTTSAGVLQPLTGGWLVWRGGFDPGARWLVETHALYLIAGACWLPVVWLQLRIRDQLAAKLAGRPFDPALHTRCRRWWFALGWPAFLGLGVVVHLMVTKPA